MKENDESTQKIASELNNLLQIIAGTTTHLEGVCEGIFEAEEYFAMLRTSIARASDVTMHLVQQTQTMKGKVILHPSLASLEHSPEVTTSARAKKRIMVVDDEKMLLILAREVLTDAGYEVETAQSGFECLDLFRFNPVRFDLVLLDLTMPLMDGEETFNRLRALRPNLPVMLCTGHVHQERLQHMLSEGLAGFIRKPVLSHELIGHVRAMLEKLAVTGGAPVPQLSAAR